MGNVAPVAAPQISEYCARCLRSMTTLAMRDSMRGTSPPSGTSDGFRDIMILGYIDQTAGARANSSECLACMGSPVVSARRLRRELVYDDVQLSVAADMIANLSERVAAGCRWRSAQGHARNDIELLALGDAARFEHGIGRGQLHVDGERCRQSLDGKRRAWRFGISRCDEQRRSRWHL